MLWSNNRATLQGGALGGLTTEWIAFLEVVYLRLLHRIRRRWPDWSAGNCREADRWIIAKGAMISTGMGCAARRCPRGLPGAVAIVVALRQPVRRAVPVTPSTSKLHQPLGRKSDHLGQQIGIGGLLHELALGHRSHRSSLAPRIRLASATGPTGKSPMTIAKPPARYGARDARAGGFTAAQIHHHQGHDRECSASRWNLKAHASSSQPISQSSGAGRRDGVAQPSPTRRSANGQAHLSKPCMWFSLVRKGAALPSTG